MPNILSAVRLALAPALLALAWYGHATVFLVCLAVSLLTDIADGFLARRFHHASELGAKLDSWGDLAMYGVLPPSVWWLWPNVVWEEIVFVAIAVAAFALPTLLGLLKFKRFTSYHTWGAKLSAVLMGPAMFLLLAEISAWPFRVAALIFAVAELEEIAITAVLPRWHADVHSLGQAMRLARVERQAS